MKGDMNDAAMAYNSRQMAPPMERERDWITDFRKCGVREWLRWPPHRKWPATSVTLGCTHVLKKNHQWIYHFIYWTIPLIKNCQVKGFGHGPIHSIAAIQFIIEMDATGITFGVWLIVVGLMTLWRGLLSSCPNTIRPIKRVRLSGQSTNQSINHSYANCMN